MGNPEPNLRAGALKLPSVIMQAVTHIAPAAGLILTLQLITKHALVTVPLSFAIAFVIVLSLGVSLAELARYLPSAGGYFTYVSRTVHPRAGFLTAWLYFLYDPLGTAINLSFVGYMMQNSLWEEYQLWFPWWLFLILATLFILVLAHRGIEVSVEFMVVLGAAEIVLLLALAATGLIKPGAGGVNLHSFLPGNVPSLGGLSLGVVYAIFCFSGFESVAPLAEESENPRRNLPRAIVGAVLFMGAFYVLCAWGLLVGWGTSVLPSFVAIPGHAENPLFQLARSLWSHGWILILLALVNSALGVSIASTNAATRVFFAMGRSGALPKTLAWVHPVHQTPTVALVFQTFVTLAVGLGLGGAIGPENEFSLLCITMTLGMVCVYCAGNLGVFLFFCRQQRSQFRLFRHALLPVVSSAGMILVGYKTIYPAPDPMPEPPDSYAPYVAAAWLGLGILLLAAMKLAGRETWLLKAGEAAYEHPDPLGTESKNAPLATGRD
jgi:amino acid transporter